MQTTVIICATLIALVAIKPLFELINTILVSVFSATAFVFCYLLEVASWIGKKMKRRPKEKEIVGYEVNLEISNFDGTKTIIEGGRMRTVPEQAPDCITGFKPFKLFSERYPDLCKAAPSPTSTPSNANDQACQANEETSRESSGADMTSSGGHAAAERELRVGDLVYHRNTPGRKMAVTGFWKDRYVRCAWYDSDREHLILDPHRGGLFVASELVKALV